MRGWFVALVGLAGCSFVVSTSGIVGPPEEGGTTLPPDGGTTPEASIDATPPNESCVVGVYSARVNTCLVTKAGAVWCWGNNENGHLGLPRDLDENTKHSTPTLVTDVPPMRAISVAALHMCGTTLDDQVWCWGRSANGSYVSTNNYYAPRRVQALEARGKIITAFGRTCTLDDAGTATCMGTNVWNEISPINDGGIGDPTPTPVEPLAELSSGYYFVCGLEPSGDVSCWGQDSQGQVGREPAGLDGGFPDPNKVLSSAQHIASANDNTCALFGGPAVSCWGRNDYGQLGDPSLDAGASATPRTVSPSPDKKTIVQLALGANTVWALDESGDVWCWGRNTEAECGPDTDAGRVDIPIKIAGLSRVKQLAGGYYHACALDPDGVKCWGYDNVGQLGSGNSTARTNPTPSPIKFDCP